MGWRENMGVKNFKPQEQKPQKEQKPPEQPPFATIAPFATVNPKTKTDPAPPPDLSKIRPEHRSEYTDLWHRACELENYTSGGAPYEDRIKRVSELNELVEKMQVLEDQTKTKPSTRPVKDKKIPGLPDDLFQAPAARAPSATDQTDRDTCPACGQSRWWRKNEAGAKWICGRCHPPAPGLDAIFRDE